MKRASFFGIEFLSGVAVGAGVVAGALGIVKLNAAVKRETTKHPETSETQDAETETEPSVVPEKKPRTARRAKSGVPTPRKSSEHEVHRAKSWKN